MKENMIEVKNVSMKFNLGIEKGFSLKQGFVDMFKKKEKINNDFWALKNVNFDVEEGEVVGFVGSNGAGKSTLLKVIAGVMKPTKGKVSVYGNICPMIELGAGFDSQLTARENIYLNGAVMGYSKEFINSKFDEIVSFSELSEFLDVPIQNFSSGMIARLAFSIATIVDPEILIVDEALSVGDSEFKKKCLEKINQIVGEKDVTFLFVTHSTGVAQSFCKRGMVMRQGKLLFDSNIEGAIDFYKKTLEEDEAKKKKGKGIFEQ